jgi:DNA recombination protein Rad52
MTVTTPTRNGRSAPGRQPTALELIRRAEAPSEPAPAEVSPPSEASRPLAPSPGFSPEQVAALTAPLDRANVRQREQGRGKVNYLEGWQLIAEANRIFGFDGWQRQTIAVRCVAQAERTIGREQRSGWGVTYTARVRVTVTAGGLPPLVREGTGAGHGIDTDLGQAHESAIKEAETDAMKRALMTFGNPFGLALYDKQQREVTGASGAPTSSVRPAARPAAAQSPNGRPQPTQGPPPSASAQPRAASPAAQASAASEPAQVPLPADTIQQLHSTLRGLPRPLLDSLTQGFRRRFKVPESAVTIADRITLQCHHDWIEAFLVSHREVRSPDQLSDTTA